MDTINLRDEEEFSDFSLLFFAFYMPVFINSTPIKTQKV